MRSSRDGRECGSCVVATPRLNLPLRLTWFAYLGVNFLTRPVGPVANQRLIDQTLILIGCTLDPGVITFADLAVRKLPMQVGERLGSSAKKHNAAGIHIQPMYHAQRPELGV